MRYTTNTTTIDCRLKDFPFWGEAMYSAHILNQMPQCDEVWDLLETFVSDEYFYGCAQDCPTDTQINDFICCDSMDFICDNVCEGYKLSKDNIKWLIDNQYLDKDDVEYMASHYNLSEDIIKYLVESGYMSNGDIERLKED